eukprot:m.240291 g.240291  ORF g.240291 m.240291 type:complete len:524 (+) comp14836_c0_seq1:212-1783(+)
MGGSASLPSVKEKDLSLFVGTWNLGNQPPANMDWIPIHEKHDIYVIGVQEAAFSKEGNEIDLHMHRLLERMFEPDYVCLGYESLTPRTDHTFKQVGEFKDAVKKGTAKASGIRIVAFIRRSLAGRDHSVHVQTYIQTCGRLQGASGNKGAVAIMIHIDGVTLSFVNNHLNAHMEQLPRRIEDYQVISRRLHYSHDTFGDEKLKMAEQDDPEYAVEVMNKSDVVFWFGDINMRLQPLEDLDKRSEMHDIVSALVRERKFSELVAFDQLKKQQKKGLVLGGFSEGKLDFVPSFKFNKPEGVASGIEEVRDNPDFYANQKSQHDELNYSKKRVPSYCDRILWKSTEGVSVTCKHYTSGKFLQASDHLPVFGTYKLKMRMIKMKRQSSQPVEGFLKLHLTNIALDTHGSSSLLNSDEHMDAPVSITIFHKNAKEVIVLPAQSDRDRAWIGDYMLESSVSIPEAMKHPVLFLVRDYTKSEEDDYEAKFFGEGMLSLLNLTSRSISINLYQGGKPQGVLTADVLFSVAI